MSIDKSAISEVSLLTEQDLYLFNEGSHLRLYEKLGAHPIALEGNLGTYFAVFAPNAKQVFLMGDFNGWDKSDHPLRSRGNSGIWESFVPGVGKGVHYKYHIVSREQNYRVDKADPFAFTAEVPPRTGSVVWDLDYRWATSRGWRTGSTTTPWTVRFPFTNCTWARGCAFP